MNNKLFYRIIFVISAIIFIISAIMLITMYMPENNDSSKYKTTTETTVSYTQSQLETESEAEIILPDNPIDFSELQEINTDVYAWIEIPGTDIDYAVAQPSGERDDLFYLDHNIEGNYEFAGTIFSQRKNEKDFSDPVTVLYGHNMLNGSMFADLHDFENNEFFEEHDTIYIYTPGHILTYQIVSAYVYDNRHILNNFDFTKKEDIEEYFDSVANPKSIVCNVRENINLDTTDNILTLSTCTNSSSQRYLVQGVLINDQLTK